MGPVRNTILHELLHGMQDRGEIDDLPGRGILG